jgi:hypothetical protein
MPYYELTHKQTGEVQVHQANSLKALEPIVAGELTDYSLSITHDDPRTTELVGNERRRRIEPIDELQSTPRSSADITHLVVEG